MSLGPQLRCADCGKWTNAPLCRPCTKVAHKLGLTVQDRLEMLVVSTDGEGPG